MGCLRRRPGFVTSNPDHKIRKGQVFFFFFSIFCLISCDLNLFTIKSEE